MMRVFLAWLLLSTAATAQSAEEAFSDGDYETAREEWLERADYGDPDAAFGLGVLNDLGLGGTRDPARAFRYYLTAADAGHAEAQFNVAVMIDAGTVRDPDPVAAAVWYARAAANGVPRAAYNLGVLYKEGIGVPPNPDLARHWLGTASETVPAAAETLETVADSPEPAELPQPRLQGGFVVPTGEETRRAELVWTSPPATDQAPFTVELLRLPEAGDNGGEIRREQTSGSALAMTLPETGRYAWRVLRVAVDGDRYATTNWSPLTPSVGDGDIPRGIVTLAFGRDDADARRLAEALRPMLDSGNFVVRFRPEDQAAETSAVSYGFPADAEIAEGVAGVLPAVGSAEAAGTDLAPGEVLVTLAGGLAAPAD